MKFPAKKKILLFLAAALGALFLWSVIRPHDYPTWFLETLPVIVGVSVLWATRRRYPLTTLTYTLLAISGAMLLVGAHYTFAKVPWGFFLRDALDWNRNPYDRIGHFMQGFVPAILVRELLLRTSPLRPRKWLFFLVLCVCLAVSAGYELLEWAAAAIAGKDAREFLSMQGDIWDAQWDMLLALVGATAALLTLSRVHDKQMAAIRQRQSGGR